ncbi:MAG: spermidine/putrescine transport system ATP-binding protein [Rhodospirillaceae bacterium]|nr:spermidine/putrescine transport system ATP-binding protein [Rhodospirillaceae bacterium]
MSVVEIDRVEKHYGSVAALAGVSLTFAEGEFFGLLGPSGSGKTTLLRAIAGFIEPDRGEIRLDGRDIGRVPVHRREIGMVFQNYALFPHMSVFENIAFGLSVRGERGASVAKRVTAMLGLVRLSGMEKRSPRQLSGGQQQRVALARALVTRPKLLLLDEPLGALDKRLRQQMQIELKQIQREVGITTVFVTHDQEEALTLSDRIAIFNEGRVVQAGTPHEVYERPKTAFAANFLGDANFFEGRVEAQGRIDTEWGGLVSNDALPAAGEPVIIAVRPEKIALVPADAPLDGNANRLQGQLAQAVYSGMSTTYKVTLGAREVTVFEQNRSDRSLAPGDSVRLEWSPAHSVVVAP